MPSSSEAAVGVTVVSVVEVVVAGEVVDADAVVASEAFWILPSAPMMGAGELPCVHNETLLREGR